MSTEKKVNNCRSAQNSERSLLSTADKARSLPFAKHSKESQGSQCSAEQRTILCRLICKVCERLLKACSVQQNSERSLSSAAEIEGRILAVCKEVEQFARFAEQRTILIVSWEKTRSLQKALTGSLSWLACQKPH